MKALIGHILIHTASCKTYVVLGVGPVRVGEMGIGKHGRERGGRRTFTDGTPTIENLVRKNFKIFEFCANNL